MIYLNYKILMRDDPEWLATAETINNAEWKAAKYLAKKMRTGKFTDWEGIVIAKDEDIIAGFCSFVKKDIVDSINYTPYVAIVYVDPNYRGRKISKELVKISENQLRRIGFQKVYIVTQHVGLYEKWGYDQIDQSTDTFGRPMRVLRKFL